tara:strand:- start:815 stop:1555 length:741 start_codon:yes stop_codon:yes gene_type:complete
MNIDAKYYVKEVLDDNQFDEFILKNKSTYSGFNITAPFKKNAYNIVDEGHSSACELNSVNCIKIENEKLIGYNTDIYGFEMMLRSKQINIENKNFLVLGNGASAETVCSVLANNNANEVNIWGRNVNKVKKFINNFNEIKLSSNLIRDYLKQENKSYILINCLPINIDQKSTDNILSYIPINNIELVIDLNYIDSKLMKKIRLLNCNIHSGYEMLLFQAIKSFEIWFETYREKVDFENIKKNIINE